VDGRVVAPPAQGRRRIEIGQPPGNQHRDAIGQLLGLVQ